VLFTSKVRVRVRVRFSVKLVRGDAHIYCIAYFLLSLSRCLYLGHSRIRFRFCFALLLFNRFQPGSRDYRCTSCQCEMIILLARPICGYERNWIALSGYNVVKFRAENQLEH